jgi:DNA repair exonuclease SbcCD nuclease subunit
MKVAAIGDAHLGRAYLPVTTPEGFNQREVDFEQAFDAAVDLALEQRPDLLVWLGDIFDHPRPTYRSFRIVQRALARIREHGVLTVVISGNHDTPRLPGTGSPYTVLSDTFPEVRFAHRLQYERFELPGLVVHAVPQMLKVDDTIEALAEADRSRSLDHTNLLLTHPRIKSVEPAHADINEIEIDDALLRSDLVLLGHYHFHVEVTKGIWYAGSTDTFTFADNPESPKGIVVLDTDTGECRHVPLSGRRPLVTLESVYALGLSPAEVQAQVIERASGVEPGAVARLFIDGVDPEAYRLLDLQAVREAGAAALHLKVEPSFANVQHMTELPELESMPAQWDRYIAEQDLTGFDRKRVAGLGRDYLARAVEEAIG